MDIKELKIAEFEVLEEVKAVFVGEKSLLKIFGFRFSEFPDILLHSFWCSRVVNDQDGRFAAHSNFSFAKKNYISNLNFEP
jgi:hypothetical protein